MEHSIRNEFVSINEQDYTTDLLKMHELVLHHFYTYPICPTTFYHRNILMRTMIHTHKWEEIVSKIKEDYPFNQAEEIFTEHWFSIFCIEYVLFNKTNNITPLVLQDKDFLERLYIRIRLTKEGWKSDSIEQMITCYYPEKGWVGHLKGIYYLIEQLVVITKTKQVGRPSLSKEIKEILKPHLKVKKLEKIRTIYSIYYQIKKITPDEIDHLIDLLDKESSSLITKLTDLKPYLYQ